MSVQSTTKGENEKKAEADVRKLEKKALAKIKKWSETDSAMLHLGMATLYVQHKGVWDMDDLLKTIADFMTGQKFKFYEKMQRHRHPGPFGVERYYVLEGVRHIDEYQQWRFWVRLETFDEHDVEVVQKDGTKKMMAKGRLWIQMSGMLDLDYDKRWGRSWFSLNLRKFFNHYIVYRKAALPWWDKVYYTFLIRLQGVIIERLKMEGRGNEERYRYGVH